MTAAPVPPDEPARLESLRAYQVLDSAPEPGFDRITSLAARLFGVPIALVSLVDEQRQWFKSCHGLDACETPRDQAFCAHAILSPDPLVVEDASLDPRFRDNPLVTNDPQIRFYAGAPLTTADGRRIGTLCIIDRVARSLGKMERDTLRDLAALVVDQLELRKFGAMLAERTNTLETSNDLLVGTNRELEDYAHMAAHGLQEPARTTASFLALLREHHAPKFDDRALQWLDIAHQGASHMVDVIRDLLAFSRASTDRLPGENFSGSEALSEVVGLLGSDIRESGADVQIVGALPECYGNAGAFSIVVQNLIRNALVFRGESLPEISIGFLEAETPDASNAMHEFYVRDNGIGFSMEYADRIFDIFGRLHTAAEYPGTGMGLAIVKRLVERHGGAFRVESEPGCGSVFRFTWPRGTTRY